MKRIYQFLLAAAVLPLLAGCGAPVGLMGDEAAGMYLTKPSEPPPADIADQMAQHESWCYSTMAQQAECYDKPQDTPPSRLVNVDPANRYPMNRKAYAEDLTQSQMADAPKPVARPAGA